jgi:hypothetical protein
VTALVAIGAALFGGIPVPRAWFHGRRRNVSVS